MLQHPRFSTLFSAAWNFASSSGRTLSGGVSDRLRFRASWRSLLVEPACSSWNGCLASVIWRNLHSSCDDITIPWPRLGQPCASSSVAKSLTSSRNAVVSTGSTSSVRKCCDYCVSSQSHQGQLETYLFLHDSSCPKLCHSIASCYVLRTPNGHGCPFRPFVLNIKKVLLY